MLKKLRDIQPQQGQELSARARIGYRNRRRCLKASCRKVLECS